MKIADLTAWDVLAFCKWVSQQRFVQFLFTGCCSFIFSCSRSGDYCSRAFCHMYVMYICMCVYIYYMCVFFYLYYIYICTWFIFLYAHLQRRKFPLRKCFGRSNWENVLNIQCFWLCMLHQQRVLKPNSLTTKQSVFAATFFWPAVSTHFGVAELGDPITCFEIPQVGIEKKHCLTQMGILDFDKRCEFQKPRPIYYCCHAPSSHWFHSRTAAQIHPWLQCGGETCNPGLRRSMLQGLLNCPKPYTML